MENYDILIVGGGASGSAIALYSAFLGYKTLLIDKGDFANATSSISTKLIHGGLRYLELAFTKLQLFQFELLFEALHERKIMIDNCPAITKELKILLPYKSFTQKYYYLAGLKIYDLIAKLTNGELKPAHIEKNNNQIPFIPYRNFIAYYDGQFLDSKYAIYNIKNAEKYGAIVKNYNKLTNIYSNNNGIEAEIENTITKQKYTVKSKLLVNATGPFSDTIRQLVKPDAEKRILRSKGVHLVVSHKDFPMSAGLLIPKTPDGRIAFMLPWHYGIILGTTDTPTEEFYPQVNKNDIDYLLNVMEKYAKIEYKHIKSYFAGVRPLILQKGKSSADIIRKHEIEVWEDKNTINVLGGKWTTHRRMAIDTLIEINKLLPKTSPKKIRNTNIKLCKKINLTTKLPEDIKKHLVIYGENAPEIANILKNNIEKLTPEYPFTTAEVKYLIKNEYAKTIEDILRRRLMLSLIDAETAKASAETVARQFSEKPEIRKKLVEEYLKKWNSRFKLLEELHKGYN